MLLGNPRYNRTPQPFYLVFVLGNRRFTSLAVFHPLVKQLFAMPCQQNVVARPEFFNKLLVDIRQGLTCHGIPKPLANQGAKTGVGLIGVLFRQGRAFTAIGIGKREGRDRTVSIGLPGVSACLIVLEVELFWNDRPMHTAHLVDNQNHQKEHHGQNGQNGE